MSSFGLNLKYLGIMGKEITTNKQDEIPKDFKELQEKTNRVLDDLVNNKISPSEGNKIMREVRKQFKEIKEKVKEKKRPIQN